MNFCIHAHFPSLCTLHTANAFSLFVSVDWMKKGPNYISTAFIYSIACYYTWIQKILTEPESFWGYKVAREHFPFATIIRQSEINPMGIERERECVWKETERNEKQTQSHKLLYFCNIQSNMNE